MGEQRRPLPPRRFYRRPEEDHNRHDEFMQVPSMPAYLAEQDGILKDVRPERGSWDAPGYPTILLEPPIRGGPQEQDNPEYH